MRTPSIALLFISLASGLSLVRPVTAQVVSRAETASLAKDEREQQQAALNAIQMLGAKVSGKSSETTTIEVGEEFRGEGHDLEQLKKVLTPSVIVLSNERTSDDWIQLASQVANLRELHLYKLNITNDGLLHLAGHSKLEVVGLYYVGNTDGALVPLKALPQVKVVKLYGTHVTPNGVDQFRLQARNVTVDYRRGAFLGVGGGVNAVISVVHRESPAANSGLSPDDVLVRLGGRIIGSFPELMEIIAQHEVGDTIDVEVARPVDSTPFFQTIARKIKLAPIPLAVAVTNRGGR